MQTLKTKKIALGNEQINVSVDKKCIIHLHKIINSKKSWSLSNHRHP